MTGAPEPQSRASRLESVRELREVYAPPTERALRKQIDHLDGHCRDFIARSPFMLLATAGVDGSCDVSPKGGPPGFVAVLDERRLAVPDAPGNRRLDSFANILENPHAGLLFLIPGLGETLRVNGRCELSTDAELRERFTGDRAAPPTALVVEVDEAYVHCAKALIRSQLWSPESWAPRDELPSAAEMLRDHRRDDCSLAQEEAALRDSYTHRLHW